MTTPRPGRPVRGSRTGRPEMAVLDLLGRRWNLRILWELRAGDALTFRELRDRCDGMSPSVLNTRLGELREARIVELLEPGGYRLTEDGASLIEALEPLRAWARGWAERGG